MAQEKQWELIFTMDDGERFFFKFENEQTAENVLVNTANASTKLTGSCPMVYFHHVGGLSAISLSHLQRISMRIVETKKDQAKEREFTQ